MLFYILLLALVGALRVFYKIYFFQKHEMLKNFSKLPFPDLPLIGHAYRLVGRSVEGKMMQVIRDFSDLNESVVMWLLGKPVVILNDPDDIRTFLNVPASSEKGSPFMGLYGNRMALLTAHVDVWRPLRRLMNSAFSLKSMKHYMKSFNSSACRMMAELDRFSDENGNVFDVARTVGRCATNAAFTSHLQMHLTDDELYQSNELMEAVLVVMGHRMMHYYYESVFNVIRNRLGIDNDVTIVEDFFVDRFEPRVTELLDNVNGRDLDDKDFDYFLKRMVRLLQTGVIDQKDKKENIILFLISSSNTGSIGAAYALLLLAMNPDVQEKLYEELKLVLNPNDDYIDYDTITNQLPYLDCVIKETLRLLPGIPLLSRKPVADITLSGNRIIPANTDVIIPIFTIHRNHDKWGRDALRFNPDNCLPENLSQQPICTYLPFAHGERSCIAYKYATILVKVMVAHAIRKYRFNTKLKLNDLRYGFAITLKINNGCLVSVERRE